MRSPQNDHIVISNCSLQNSAHIIHVNTCLSQILHNLYTNINQNIHTYRHMANFVVVVYINAKWQIPVSYGSKLHIPSTNYHLLAARQEPYKKKKKKNTNNTNKKACKSLISLNEKYQRIFLGKHVR